MRKILKKAKSIIKNLHNRIKPVIVKGIKFICKIIWDVIWLLSSLTFFGIPFMNSWMDKFIAQCIWYPAFAIIVILFIRESFRKDEPIGEETVVDHVGKWGLWAIIFSFLSIFVIRYYHITYIWLWVIFGVVAIYVFWFFLSFLSYNLNHREVTKDERQKYGLNAVKSILLYWLFDLTYMGIFNDWFWVTIICGTLAVTLVFYNLVIAFIDIAESLKGWLVPELLFGLGIVLYLIYIIPDDTLQSIIVAIVAALFGGLFTLIGVAWTIKKGDIDRKEDERKKNIPYMKVVHGIKEACEVCAHMYEGLDLSNTKELEKADGNSLYLITIEDCIMKNISESNIILRGMLFDDKKYEFSDPVILEKGEVCKIRITDNHSVVVPNLESILNLIVNDTLDNMYSIECKLTYVPVDRMMTTIVEECEYVCFEFEGVVGSVKLPVLVDGKR